MNSIEISNFKNFRNLKIDNLGRINLIVGRNNTGKSTLLEAISVLASGGDVSWMKTLLEIRGMNMRIPYSVEQPALIEFENFVTLYYNRDREAFEEMPISIKSTDIDRGRRESDRVEIKLVEFVQIVETDDNGSEVRRRVVLDSQTEGKTVIDGEIRPGLQIIFNDNRTLYTFGSMRVNTFNKKTAPFEYVRTTEFTGAKNSVLFDKVSLTPLESVLIDALNIIDPRIKAINFLNDDSRPRRVAGLGNISIDNRIPYVVLEDSARKYRLSTMGDGVNRILTIILSMLNCRDGILLIDEFENGLHYSVQTPLWDLISRLARELNVQVFATTHSRDCIKSFLTATRTQGDISRLIRLEKRRSGDTAVMYDDEDELNYINDNDIETR